MSFLFLKYVPFVYGHVYTKREDFPDYGALVNAEEVTVNEDLPEPLPVRGILLGDFPELKPDQDTMTRYRILVKNSSKSKQNPVPAAGTPRKGSGHPANSQSTGGTKSELQGNGGLAPSAQANNTGTQGTKGQQLDNHDRWSSIKADEAFAKATVEATLIDLLKKGAKPTEYEEKIIADAMKGRGTAAGNGVSTLDPSERPTLCWQSLLRRYVGKEVERIPTYARPNRRFPKLVGIVPGHSSLSAKPKIMCVIDTSGSMSDSNLADISKELHVMARKFEVHVVECDTVIHKHYKYNGRIERVYGRGGTSFLPPLEKEFLKQIKPDLIIFFTDGDGDAPKMPPRAPVIWVLTTGGKSPVKWGKVIHMEKSV